LGGGKMRHRDDARAVSASRGDARIGDDFGKGVCPVVGAQAPFIENNDGAWRLDKIEEVREARKAVRIGGEKIDRDEVEAELLDRQGDGRVGEPLDQSEQHWTRVEDQGAPRLG
jgi:hypothetical protein